MFDHKETDEVDDNVLSQIIEMCEQHMGSSLGPKEEAAEEVPAELGIESEPVSEAPESGASDLENADLDELMEMYKNMKG